MNEFKVGDWYETPNGKVLQVKTAVEEGSYIQLDCRKWQPKEGEWCWISDESSKRPYLQKWRNQIVEHCEPFIGELPSFLYEATNIYECIAKPDVLMNQETCEGCVYEDKDGVLNVECAFCLRNSNDNFKPKDTQC